MQQNQTMNQQVERLYKAASDIKKLNSPSAIARFLNESPQTVKNWESRGISKSGLIKAHQLIGCSLEWLEFGTGEMFPRGLFGAPPPQVTITSQPTKEFSPHAAALARLFDSIPADDLETRGKAFATAGQAINAAIQESLSKLPPVRNLGLPE